MFNEFWLMIFKEKPGQKSIMAQRVILFTYKYLCPYILSYYFHACKGRQKDIFLILKRSLLSRLVYML